MDPKLSMANEINRRTFLGYGVSGLGMLALNGLVNPLLFAARDRGRPGRRKAWSTRCTFRRRPSA